jgi:hypothetical protein
MEMVTYHGWRECVRLANGVVELVVTTAVGPRIIHFSFIGNENEFATVPDDLGKTGGDEWRIYGGHRFWHAPEEKPRTYYPDNEAVAAEERNGFVRLIQPVERTTGLQKELDIALAASEAKVTVIHRLRNHNLWAVTLAPWALSVMAVGGTAVLPLPPRGSHADNLLPNTQLNLWAYTNMADPRWYWGEKYVLLRQEPGNTIMQKVGAMVTAGWVGYVRNHHLFLKTFAVQPNAIYPDLNSNVELFTCDFMTEVETLGPLSTLPPGGTVTHVEQWQLFDGIPTPATDADVETHILTKLPPL